MLSYEAGRVGTKLIGQKPKGTIISVETAVKSSLRDLGYEARTNGAFIHEVVMSMVMKAMPDRLRNKLIYGESVKDLAEARRNETNEKKMQ